VDELDRGCPNDKSFMQFIVFGLIGDFDPQSSLIVLFSGLELAAFRLRFCEFSGLDAQLNTYGLHPKGVGGVCRFWCVPVALSGMDGARATLSDSSGNTVPISRDCGGFQHAVIEYARSVSGTNADSYGVNPAAGPFNHPTRLPYLQRLWKTICKPDRRLPRYGTTEIERFITADRVQSGCAQLFIIVRFGLGFGQNGDLV